MGLMSFIRGLPIIHILNSSRHVHKYLPVIQQSMIELCGYIKCDCTQSHIIVEASIPDQDPIRNL